MQSMSLTFVQRAELPLTPCIGVCRLDARGYCVGCRRTSQEIAMWRELPDAERVRYMDDVLPTREDP
jgi:uncharacterized protein